MADAGHGQRDKRGHAPPWILIAFANVYDHVCAHSGRAPRKKIEMTRRNAALCLSLVVLLIGLAAAQDRSNAGGNHGAFSMRVLAGQLEGPWEMSWGPDGRLWVTERTGKRVTRINPADGTKTVAVTIPDVHQSASQDGLLGMALHPELLRGTGADY